MSSPVGVLLQSVVALPMDPLMITVMTAVMTGVGTAATATFTSALTTSLWNTGTRLVRGSRSEET